MDTEINGITLEDIISLGWVERTDDFYVKNVLPRGNYRSFSKGRLNLEWWSKGREDYHLYKDMNICTSIGTLPLLIFDSKWHNITSLEELQKLNESYENTTDQG